MGISKKSAQLALKLAKTPQELPLGGVRVIVEMAEAQTKLKSLDEISHLERLS